MVFAKKSFFRNNWRTMKPDANWQDTFNAFGSTIFDGIVKHLQESNVTSPLCRYLAWGCFNFVMPPPPIKIVFQAFLLLIYEWCYKNLFLDNLLSIRKLRSIFRCFYICLRIQPILSNEWMKCLFVRSCILHCYRLFMHF